MTAPTFALALPHTPWIPERVASFERLRQSFSVQLAAYMVKVFAEQESNRVWSQKMWRWAIETGASHLVQLQDDVIVSPNFWSALRAMVDAQPHRLIGLHSNHPLAPVQFRAGRRWYRDRWLTGPAYVFPSFLLACFLEWCDEHPNDVARLNEDSLISHWCVQENVDVWHPVPTITDVDQGIPSTYGNDDHYEWSMYRRPLVTWRDAVSLAALEDPDWWRCIEDAAPLMPGPGTQLCWFCGEEEGPIANGKTGARLGKQCLAHMLGVMVNRL